MKALTLTFEMVMRMVLFGAVLSATASYMWRPARKEAAKLPARHQKA